jgi:hypothetical protein
MVRRLVLPLVAVVAVVGCIGAYDVKAPPVPNTTRTPTIIGVAGPESDGVYRLEDGTIVDVGGPRSSAAPAALLGEEFHGAGSLLLFGEDAQGRFYAAARARDEQGCFRIYGGTGYIDPGRIHYSSGLVVPFAEGIKRKNNRDHIDHTWLFEFDLVCLNEAGQVTLIEQLSFLS